MGFDNIFSGWPKPTNWQNPNDSVRAAAGTIIYIFHDQ